jgi:Mn-containing catalase
MTGQAPQADAAGKPHPLGTNVQSLREVLKFDPTVEALNNEIFAEALKEITEERNKKIKAKAKEQLLKAMELNEKMKKLKKQTDDEMKKFDKELGKIMRQIKATMEGKSAEEVEESEKTDKDSKES